MQYTHTHTHTRRATNSHSYLYESRTVPRSASMDQVSCSRAFFQLVPALSFPHSERPKKSKDKLPNLTDLHTSPTSHSLSVKHLVFVSMSKHNRAVETEFLSSGSPQGLSSPMLVVIFLSCHCSLLCSPSFLIILSAIYQTMKSERKKKIELVVFLHYGLCQVFWGKMFCVFSLPVA